MRSIKIYFRKSVASILMTSMFLLNAQMTKAATSGSDYDSQVFVTTSITSKPDDYYEIITKAYNMTSDKTYIIGRVVIEDPTITGYDKSVAASDYYDLSLNSSDYQATIVINTRLPQRDYLNVIWCYSMQQHFQTVPEYFITIPITLPDVTPPTLTATASTTWATSSVINISASDYSGLGGLYVNDISIPISTTSYKVYINGNYIVKAVDTAGNQSSTALVVTNIDAKKPDVSVTLKIT